METNNHLIKGQDFDDFYVSLDGRQADIDHITGEYFFDRILESRYMSPTLDWRVGLCELMVPGQ